jgi:iron complex outermembrane receptor protein
MKPAGAKLRRRALAAAGAAAAAAALGLADGADAQQDALTDELVVTARARSTIQPAPATVLTAADLVAINAPTTEDLVKYEPGLVVRQRYVGDASGTLGMRGSNMFQTARSMVFADGLPLHYFLETRYDGAPRWSLVGADEIESVEVLYGPFSAEYSGNAMGGVVNLTTRTPIERTVYVVGSVFRQGFEAGGFDGALPGSRFFASYGDKLGRSTVYVAYSRLENESQPLEYLLAYPQVPTGGERAVDGTLAATDEYGVSARYVGNTGRLESAVELLKTRLGFEAGEWDLSGTVAYERRHDERSGPHNYVATADGAAVWSGRVDDGGAAFTLRGGDFAVDSERRANLLVGARVVGPIADDWRLEATLSRFDVLRDETRTSALNPADPAYSSAGEVTACDDTGWRTAEVKLRSSRFLGDDRLDFVGGYRYERYGLRIDDYDSDDYGAGEKTALATTSGGQTELDAVYAQLDWRFTPAWDLAAGARFERWKSLGAFFRDRPADELIAEADRDEADADRSEDRFSPKLSLGFDPSGPWRFRYSAAKAYRFPIVDELFHNERRTTGTSLADADLDPEDGSHHDLLLERVRGASLVRVNVFVDDIDDVIFNQTASVDNRRLSTFLPLDRVRTRGADFVYDRLGIFGRLDLRLNATYVDAVILRNAIDLAIEGNTFPRMPAWRAHLLATYHPAPRWTIGGGVRYSAASFGDLDNSDTAKHVFGAHDAYTQLNVRLAYRLTEQTELRMSVDNLTDEIAYVHHPWPGRTVFIEAALNLKAKP